MQLKIQREEKVELTEEETLNVLRERYEDIVKAREEQNERLERVRARNKDLLDKRKSSEQEIVDFIRQIDDLNKQIRLTKDAKIDKEGEKQRLNEETVTLRAQIEEQKKVVEEKQVLVGKAKEETVVQ